jgi:hypothetical protein
MDIWTDRWIYGQKIDTWKEREGRTERRVYGQKRKDKQKDKDSDRETDK